MNALERSRTPQSLSREPPPVPTTDASTTATFHACHLALRSEALTRILKRTTKQRVVPNAAEAAIMYLP
eukprot:scaffold1941_cov263-Pinguiococcus_pyrenoidosus.AAC.8